VCFYFAFSLWVGMLSIFSCVFWPLGLLPLKKDFGSENKFRRMDLVSKYTNMQLII
jgi:hypothetical protein